MSRAFHAGFSSPALAAQEHFRGLLAALAEPGLPVELTGEVPSAPPPLAPGAFALMLTLADFESPVWLEPGLAEPAVQAALRFHCGCPLVSEPTAATFALIGSPAAALPLERFAVGTSEYPDRSATLLIATTGFFEGPPVRLRGPGIADARELRIDGTSAAFWAAVAGNHGLFPQGVDFIFVAGRRVIGLPRSTDVELV